MPFSSDHGLPPTRFRASAGQVGADAAGKALKPPSQGKQKSGQPQRSGGRGRQSESQSLGLPSRPEPEQANLTQAGVLYQRWLNARALGRDISFGHWLTRTGYSNQVHKPGEHPFDVFAGDDEYKHGG